MDLFRRVLFRYRDNVKCILINNFLVFVLFKIFCFKGCRGCKGEGDMVFVFKEFYYLIVENF